MIRILAALVVSLASFPAYAACVWSSTGSYSVKAVCADGDEVAPTLVTEGLSLAAPTPFFAAPRYVAVTLEADSGQTITSGTLKVYTWDPITGAWARHERDLPVSVSGERRLNLEPFTVLVPGGRIAIVPSVVVLSAGGISIYLTASP